MTDRAGVVTSDPRQELRLAAGILATVIALIHLLHPQLGAPRLVEYLEIGRVFNPLPLLFTAGAILIVFGIIVVHQGLFVRATYLLGILLMVTFVIGYGLWHSVLGHGAFWPTVEGQTHSGPGYLRLLWLHLREDLIGAVSKVLELTLAAVLAMLYMLEQPR